MHVTGGRLSCAEDEPLLRGRECVARQAVGWSIGSPLAIESPVGKCGSTDSASHWQCGFADNVDDLILPIADHVTV